MKSPIHADLLIIGGGCAGLSLARELIQQNFSGRVIVLEKREAYANDRSWSFWAAPEDRSTNLAAASWRHWRYATTCGRSSRHTANDKRYYYVPSDRFYDHVLELIGSSDNVELVTSATIEDIDRDSEITGIRCKDRTFRARHVVDTRPPRRQRLGGATLFQCFSGRILKLPPGSLEDTTTVELMTEMRSDRRGFAFDYVLPMADDCALFEATRFSDRVQSREAMDRDLDEMIQRRGLVPHSVQHREYAVLPMGLPDPAVDPDDPVVRAGTAAGALRPATGYAFLRIQRWARACAKQINGGQAPKSHPPDSRLQRWMDALFLQVMRKNPERVPELFMRLAEDAGQEALVRFLSDRATARDRLRVISSLPTGLFLRHLI